MVRASDKSPNSQIHQTIYNWVRVIISLYNCPKFELIAKLTPLLYGLLWQRVEGAPPAPPSKSIPDLQFTVVAFARIKFNTRLMYKLCLIIIIYACTAVPSIHNFHIYFLTLSRRVLPAADVAVW